MIPKIIHYCWFGKKELPPLALKCIESWRKYLPDYEIKEWNEDNFNINITPYVSDAYKQKKYAFVSDYARFWIIYNYGGIYFDTDVEVLKSMDDLIAKGPFMGCENTPTAKIKLAVNPGLGFGGYAKMIFFKDVINLYENIQFNDYKDNNGPITIVQHVTKLLNEKGLKNTSDIQKIENITIYPKEYFSPLDYYSGKIYLTPKTYTFHHFNGSWTSKKDKLFLYISRTFGFKFAKLCSSIYKKIMK